MSDGPARYTQGMSTVARRMIALAAVLGFTAVALGAFGAHGLRSMLEGADDGAQRLDWWRTGAQYHLAHALAVGLAAPLERWLAPGLFAGGVVLFSGSLYAMALGGPRVLGAVTPFGGVLFLSGWVVLGVTALRRP